MDTILSEKKASSVISTRRQSFGVGDAVEFQSGQLDKDFNLLSTLGIAFSYIATPLSIGTYLVLSVGAGGSPYFFYGYLTAFVCNTLVALSLAEMAAFLPHSSGQIFWAAKLAPSSTARAFGYFNGGFTMMAWTFWTAGTYLFAAELVLSFVSVCGATWLETNYQIFLLYVAFALFALLFNTVLFKAVPMLSKLMIGYINIGSLFILIALLVRANPKQSAKTVFVDVVNSTGWNDKGLVFFLSLLPGVTAINGFDTAAHMADELPNPARQVPQVMVGTVLLCGFAALPMVITFLFCITNSSDLLASSQPIFTLFQDSMDSFPLTIIACLIYLGLFTFASGSILTTLSRCWWSFAECGAFPFAQWQSAVSSRWTLPINSLIVLTIIEILIGLLIFGPSTVLTSLIASAAVCFYISYAIPITLLLLRGRKDLPAKRYFNLGKMGAVINTISVCWASIVSVFLCFPSYLPVTTANMNYTIAVIAVGTLIFAINWFAFAKKSYQVPAALVSQVSCTVTFE